MIRRFARVSWPCLLLLTLLAVRAAGCRKTKEAPGKATARTPHWITPLMTPPPTLPPVPTRRGMTPIPTLPG